MYYLYLVPGQRDPVEEDLAADVAAGAHVGPLLLPRGVRTHHLLLRRLLDPWKRPLVKQVIAR